ncbi:MAG: S-methyl-5'-thioadenosine phosphorylase [Lentisphaeraceae bacterium]|nr:S-methyl-5'-thioadenosine phosphorylase [Lentisphaeraceae bacterium]
MNIGVIGGSGLYDIDGVELVEERTIETPYGSPSDSIKISRAGNNSVFFMARHGQGHRLLPHELNHHANIWAMKKLGVETIISLSAIGSLSERYNPLDFVLVDQYVDNTRKQGHSFFGDGAVAHVSLADPACLSLSKVIFNYAVKLFKDIEIHPSGTYLNMEGPAFSTKAESKMYRQWGMDVIGMTNFLEAKLAREAEICYQTVAMVTDYDCWHPGHAAVTVEKVIENLGENSKKAKLLLKELLPSLQYECSTDCQNSLKSGLMTPIPLIPEKTAAKLQPILEKYRK